MANIVNPDNDLNELNNNQDLNWLSNNFRNNIFSDILKDLNITSKYFNEESFIASISNKEFVCLSLNACSLPANIEEIKILIQYLKNNNITPAVLFIQEVRYSMTIL